MLQVSMPRFEGRDHVVVLGADASCIWQMKWNFLVAWYDMMTQCIANHRCRLEPLLSFLIAMLAKSNNHDAAWLPEAQC